MIVAQYEHCERFRSTGSFDFDEHARLYLRLATQREFNVSRVNVHTCRGDNDLPFSAFEIEAAFLVDLTNIAGAKPAIVCVLFLPAMLPIPGRHILAPHQNFAVPGGFHFLTRKYSADGNAVFPERVIDADERRSLSHAVALNHGESKPLPELLGIRVERRAT